MVARKRRSSVSAAPSRETQTRLGTASFIVFVVNFFLLMTILIVTYVLPEEETIYDIIPILAFLLLIVGVVISVILGIFSVQRKETSRVLGVLGAVLSVMLIIFLVLFIILGVVVLLTGA